METGAPSNWRTTAWSVIVGAQGGGEEGRRCLENLCRTYWKPAYYYARRRGMNHHDAADCVQEFFARMFDKNWLARVEQDRGSFRGWLLTALRRWVSRSRTITGADRFTVVSDDAVRSYEREDDQVNPDDLFNRAWAQSCLDEALRLIVSEQRGTSREQQVLLFAFYLEHTAEDGDPPSYEVLAQHFEVPVSTITNWLHRARSLFRTYLLRVVRDTLDDHDAAEIELNRLRSYLE
jgi:RNA polymerase sigma factor (sigma-70 family)